MMRATAFQGANGSPIPAVARGSLPQSLGRRNTPTIMYASFAPPFGFIDDKDEETGKVEKVPAGGQFLDGRASDLLAQFEGPLLDPLEMNAPSKKFAVEKIRDGAYAGLAREVYGDRLFDNPDAAFEKLAQSVVAYESSARFHPFASKFDDFLRGKAQLTGPYLHNGVFGNLRDVVAFYATRDTDPKRWYTKDSGGKIEKFNDLPAVSRANVNTEEIPYDRRKGQKPRLSEKDVDAIVAFLETLTDRRN